MALFGSTPPTAAPAEAPAPTKPEKNVRAGAADSPSGASGTSADASVAVSLNRQTVKGVTVTISVAIIVSCLWIEDKEAMVEVEGEKEVVKPMAERVERGKRREGRGMRGGTTNLSSGE
ncbi:hypothetical protein CR513_59995, partial [Mucuna pruriens]